MRKTVSDIRNAKGKTPLVCLTAYSAPMAKILDPHCDILLVGDSLGMVLYGMDNTRFVNLPIMINHGKAVVKNSSQALVVVDLPYGYYEDNINDALRHSSLVMDKTGCNAIKLEGGANMAEQVQCLVKHDIPVMGHIGLLPQSAPDEGGYKIKGKTAENEQKLLDDAKALQNAGAFALVIEGTIEPVARAITESISIPTIGIGASPACDGQILVTDDMLGMFETVPRFVKKYANLAGIIDETISAYANEVRERKFPEDTHAYKKT